jgi:oxaloacetate decarboxylase gamma subunit
MSELLQSAFSLLLIGMITVFAILGLVVLTGRLLIYLVNRFDPQTRDRFIGTPKTIFKPKTIPRAQLAAITAAVEAITEGKGKISHIEKEKK